MKLNIGINRNVWREVENIEDDLVWCEHIKCFAQDHCDSCIFNTSDILLKDLKQMGRVKEDEK